MGEAEEEKKDLEVHINTEVSVFMKLLIRHSIWSFLKQQSKPNFNPIKKSP